MNNQFLTEESQKKIEEAKSELIKKGYSEAALGLDHYIEREYDFYSYYVANAGIDFEKRDGLIGEYNGNVPIYIKSACSGLV